MRRRCRSAGAVAEVEVGDGDGLVELPVTLAPPARSDRARVSVWCVGPWQTSLLMLPTPPLSFLYGAVRRGPPTSLGWTPPIRARVGVGLSRWTEPIEIDTNILPLDLIFHSFILVLLNLTCSIAD